MNWTSGYDAAPSSGHPEHGDNNDEYRYYNKSKVPRQSQLSYCEDKNSWGVSYSSSQSSAISCPPKDALNYTHPRLPAIGNRAWPAYQCINGSAGLGRAALVESQSMTGQQPSLMAGDSASPVFNTAEDGILSPTLLPYTPQRRSSHSYNGESSPQNDIAQYQTSTFRQSQGHPSPSRSNPGSLQQDSGSSIAARHLSLIQSPMQGLRVHSIPSYTNETLQLAVAGIKRTENSVLQPWPVGYVQNSAEYPMPVVPQVYHDADDQRFVDVQNPETGVRTYFQTAPVERITDPDLYRSGVRSIRMLIGTGREGEEEPLFEGFRVRERPRQFFTVGKVFLVLWVEPAGEGTSRTVVTSIQPGIIDGRHGEQAYSKVRRFVVIRAGNNYCSAVPITTYCKQGVSKAGVNKSEHAIIYTGKTPPQPLPQELAKRGEAGMRPQPIRVDTDQPFEKLDPLSRIDFGKVHTIQHNIKVKSFGKVNNRSEAALSNQFQSVWSQSIRAS